ncbi:PAQR family membrane homeostasis protein TrhA [Nocardioides jejuensis]|nr:hemolysin III family protein [Nocardioides jejuensis]
MNETRRAGHDGTPMSRRGRAKERAEAVRERAVDAASNARDRAQDARDRAVAKMADKMAEVKPHMRGWLHAGSIPLMTAAFAVLIALSPSAITAVGSSVYAASALLLFGVSGIYHRGTWAPRMWAFWRRFDHANIYVFIAGTYTPVAFLYLHGGARWTLIGVAWGCALAGLIFKIGWPGAPRWVAMLYVAMGWLAVLFIPQFHEGAGQFPTWVNVSTFTLIAVGGVLYTVGAVVYATKRPNPSPTWFGFHEVFHLFTVLAFICQYIAVSIATYALR